MIATLSHSDFVQPTEQDASCWRYLTLPKFLDLLQTEEIFFCRLDKLDDNAEGTLTKPSAHAMYEIIDDFESQRSSAGYSKSDLSEKLPRTIEKMKEEVFVNCWHINEYESYAMWSTFSGEGEGICIKCKYSSLANQFDESVFVGLVQYIDYENELLPSFNLLAPAMHKTKEFEYEQEVRALIWRNSKNEYKFPSAQNSPSGIKLGVKLNEVIEEVVVHPKASALFYSVVDGISRKYGLTSKVRRSILKLKS